MMQLFLFSFFLQKAALDLFTFYNDGHTRFSSCCGRRARFGSGSDRCTRVISWCFGWSWSSDWCVKRCGENSFKMREEICKERRKQCLDEEQSTNSGSWVKSAIMEASNSAQISIVVYAKKSTNWKEKLNENNWSKTSLVILRKRKRKKERFETDCFQKVPLLFQSSHFPKLTSVHQTAWLIALLIAKRPHHSFDIDV